MIKKVYVLTLLLLSFQLAKSQVLISILLGDKLNTGKIEFGLDIGYNVSQMSGFESTQPLGNLNLGFYFDFLLKKQWYINTGVLVKSDVGVNDLSQNDVSILDPTTIYSDTGTYSQNISYFHVPVAIKYRFKNHLYVHLGPQFALRTKASLRFKDKSGDKTIEINTDNRDLFNRLEVAAIGGIGYKLRQGKGMNLGIKYFYGLTNVFKDTYHSVNSSFYIYAGIPIGRGKVDIDE